MKPADHVSDEEIIQAVSVYIREIRRHRKMRSAADRLPRNRAKPALTITQPEPVRVLEVVADVDVGISVLIDIADHYREAQVPGRLCQGRPVFVTERPVSPRHFSEAALAIIEVK